LSLTATIVGCSSHKEAPPTAPPVVTAPPTPAVQQPFTGHVNIYAVANANQSAEADQNGLVAVPIVVNTKAKDPAREAIMALIDCPNSPIPHGTKLLKISINKDTGLATLDFSNEFKNNFPGGDTQEAQVLNSVLETMGQFPNVQNVQFLVAGAKIDSLGGTEDLTDPLPAIKVSDEAEAASAG
jgi:germination protein M